MENSLSTVVLVAVAACGPAPAAGSNIQGTGAVYRLASINGVSPTDSSLESDCDSPLFDEYRIQGGQWWERVTFKGQGQCKSLADAPSLTRADSGVYKVRGDTLHFYSYDKSVGITKYGLAGWVDFGVLRGDTLLFPGGVFTPSDPGDMVYLRVR